MGNALSTLSACCGGNAYTLATYVTQLTLRAGRQKDGLYEPALAESEREAVAELLAYLENVCQHDHQKSADNLQLHSGRRQTSSPVILCVP